MITEERLAAFARQQHGLVAREQLLRIGWDDRRIGTATSVGRLERVQVGVYRVAGVPPSWPQSLLAGCLAGGEGTVASHRAAAKLWGLLEGEQPVELSALHERNPRVRQAVVHRSSDLGAAHVTVRDGVPLTTSARTLVDLGAVVPRWIVSDALERALVARLLTPGSADAILDAVGRKGRSGVGALRAVLDDRALGWGIPDGLLEPRMARLLRTGGLPNGEFQHVVVDRADRFVARVDFAWPARRLIVEVDGFGAHGTPKAMSADLARQNRLVALGWVVLRFTWDQVVRRPATVIDQLRPLLGT